MSCLHAEFKFLDLNGATQEELYQIKGILSSRVGESLELPWNIEGEEAHENDSGVEPEATGSEYVYGVENVYVDPSAATGHHQMAALDQQQHHVLEFTTAHQHQAAVVTTCGPAGFYVFSSPKFVMTSEAGSMPVVDGSDVYATAAHYDVHGGIVQNGKSGRKKRQHGPPPVSAVAGTMDTYGGQAPHQPVGMMLPHHHHHHHPGHMVPFVPSTYCQPHPGAVYMISPAAFVPAPRNATYASAHQHYAAPPAAAFAAPMPHAAFTFISPQQHEQVTVLAPEDVHDHGEVVVLELRPEEEGLVEEEYDRLLPKAFENADSFLPPETDNPPETARQPTQWSEDVESAEQEGEEEEEEEGREEEGYEPGEEPSEEKTEKDPVGHDEALNLPSKDRSWASLFVNVVAPPAFSHQVQTPVAEYSSSSQHNGEARRNQSPPVEEDTRRRPTWRHHSRIKDALWNPDLDHRTVYVTPRGLVNKGNWCYINAILQALLVCPPFYNLIKKLSRLPDMKRDGDTFPILRSMVKFVMEFPTPARYNTREPPKAEQSKKGEVHQGQAFEPTYVYEVLGSVKTDFFKGRQEDAEEFLSWLLNGLHEEMLKAIGPVTDENGTMNNGTNGDPSISNGDVYASGSRPAHEEEWKEMGRRNKSVITRSAKSADSPISTIFGGVMVSAFSEPGMTKCANKEPFFTLPLDIQSDQVTSLKEAIEGLFSKETVHGYTSSKTKEEVEASRKISLESLPPVLILHLKRFVYEKDGGCKKLTKRIEFPIDLEIGRDFFAVRSRLLPNERKFKLFAVVYHSGKETAKGHYVTDVYHSGTSGWLRTDDSCVTPVTLEQVLRHYPPRVPYLLFYRRFDTIYPANNSYGK